MKQDIKLTVAIPTYNGAVRLPLLIEKLKNQIQTENFDWEIIIVDNNSTDSTAQLIRDYQASWHHSYSLKYYLETQQGAAFARKKAICEAQGELIAFLDDDNYPEPNWVASAYEFAQNHSQAGAYGSQIHPLWEVEPSDEFKQRLAAFLAITERGSEPLLYQPSNKLLPPSAGLVIRKQAWLDSVPEKPILTGRVSGNMLTGEDIEMLSHIQKQGWEIWYNPAMEIYHDIPYWRTQKEYLLPFFRGIGLSRYVTRMVNTKSYLQPVYSVLYLLSDLRKILLHLIKYGHLIRTELVSACEMQLFIGSLISPFYLWKNGYFQK